MKRALGESPARTAGVVLMLVVLALAIVGQWAENRRTQDRITVIENNFSADARPYAPFADFPTQRVLNREGTVDGFDGPVVQIGSRLTVEGRKCLKPAAGGGRPGPVAVVSEGNRLTFTNPRHRDERDRQAREGVYQPESLELVDGLWCRVFEGEDAFRNEIDREDMILACSDLAQGITPTAVYGASETPIPPGAQRPVPGVWTTEEFAFVDDTGACEQILAIDLLDPTP